MNGRFGRAAVVGIFSCLLAACAGQRPNNLGVKNGMLAPCPSSSNCVSSFAADGRHRIEPLAFTGDPDAAFVRLKKVISGRRDASVVEEKDDYLRVELRTRLFVDDAEFLLDRGRNVVQVRSASRIGYSDLGKNRRRVEEIRDALRGSSSGD